MASWVYGEKMDDAHLKSQSFIIKVGDIWNNPNLINVIQRITDGPADA
jgi:hypothetical protein